MNQFDTAGTESTEISRSSANAFKARVVMMMIVLAAVIGMALGVAPSPANAAPVTPVAESVGAIPTGWGGLAEIPAKPPRWAADTAKFAGCLGGFGFAAAPVVAGFMFGGPGGAAKAAKAWFPKLGPAGSQTMKWCMQSVLGVRV